MTWCVPCRRGGVAVRRPPQADRLRRGPYRPDRRAVFESDRWPGPPRADHPGHAPRRSGPPSQRAGALHGADQPAALWDGLHARLETYGWTRHDNCAQLIRGVEPPPETLTDLRIERVFAERAEAITDIICTAFELLREYGAFFVQLVGRPRWRHYVALDGETPVATGALFVRGLVGYLTFGATLSSHRCLGAQGAIMARRIKDAAALGCRWLVTETMEQTSEHSNPSYRNMLRMGFRLVYLRPNYIYFPR
jgi:hypothetical protein